MDDFNLNYMDHCDWSYMMEKMQSIKLFSRSMIVHGSKEYEIPAQHLELLSCLSLNGKNMTPLNISKMMGVSKTIISRILDKLLEEGYITKTKNDIDKRSYNITITDLGQNKLEKIYKFYLTPIYTLRKELGNKKFTELITNIENANKLLYKLNNFTKNNSVK
jgi:DNA-binding MarR family transcriptional regulator